MSAALLALGLALLRAPSELSIRCEVPTPRVEFGAAFVIEVVAGWPAGLPVEPFDDSALRELGAECVAIERRDAEGRTEERRRYEGRAYSLVDLPVPALSLRAQERDGDRDGELDEASSEARTITVVPLVDHDEPGGIELPGELLEVRAQPSLTKRLLVAALVLVFNTGFLAFFLRRARAKSVDESEWLAREWDFAEAKLRRLAGVTSDPDFAAALADGIRFAVERRFAIPARGASTEEIEARLAGDERSRGEGARIVDSLRRCDAVLFARGKFAEGEREALLERALGLRPVPAETAS